MKKNLRKKPNNFFIKFGCCICLDIFEAEEYVYETAGGDLVCYRCAEEPKGETIKRIDKKIDYLKGSKKYYLNNLR